MTDDQEEYPALLPYYKKAAVMPVYWANKSQKFYVAADVLWKAQKSDLEERP